MNMNYKPLPGVLEPIRSIVILVAISICISFSPLLAAAQTFYVRPGATGANNGNDWANAYTSLPNSLVRGSTYYIADGTYSSYTFDDSASGTAIITIKKATASDNGTWVGWDSSYGDGQAIFGPIVFKSSYYSFDGQTRDESSWTSSSAYGFVINGGNGGNNAKLIDVSSADNIIIRHVYAYYNNIKTGSDINENRDHGLYSLSGSNNINMEYCYLKNTSWKAAILINSTSGPITINNNVFENIFKKELFSARSTDNVTFSNNYCKNIAGTGALVADDSDNWDIFGNIFWSPNSSFKFTDVIIGTWTGDHPSRTETLNNWKIYNNTFYQMNGATKIEIQKGTGNIASNNLFLNFSSSITGSITASNNDQGAPIAIVNNASSGKFQLVNATSQGDTLQSKYNTDMNGNQRGKDGTWDRGALEYTGDDNSSGTDSSAAIPSTPTNLKVVAQ
jgi:hypothetical protein